MKRFLLPLLIACICVTFFGGCASTKSGEEEEQRVSTTPWNRPAGWEGQGQVGGMMGGMGGMHR